jgi:hypothetical protein
MMLIWMGHGMDWIIQWKPLNGITLGQRQIDSNNRLIIISESGSAYIKYERVVWDLSILIILIPLTN